MKEIRTLLDQFALEDFVDRTADFIRKSMFEEEGPIYGLAYADRVGSVPVYVFGPDDGWQVPHVLKEEKAIVFFPFACTMDDQTLLCAGRFRYLTDQEDEIPIGCEDVIGYLVQVNDGTVIINSAIHAGGFAPLPLPGIDFFPDCRILDEPMRKFVRGFIYEEETEAETDRCIDCGCREGDLHRRGCFREECPFCGGQLVTCKCIYEILDLPAISNDPKTFSFAPWMYENGLSPEQEELWFDALDEKGRRPYIWWPIVCARCGGLMPPFFMAPDEDWEKYIDPSHRQEVVCLDCYLDIMALIDAADRGW